MKNGELQRRLSEFPDDLDVVRPVDLHDDAGDLLSTDYEEPDPVRINLDGITAIAL